VQILNLQMTPFRIQRKSTSCARSRICSSSRSGGEGGFRRYLELAPDAEDKEQVGKQLSALTRWLVG